MYPAFPPKYRLLSDMSAEETDAIETRRRAIQTLRRMAQSVALDDEDRAEAAVFAADLETSVIADAIDAGRVYGPYLKVVRSDLTTPYQGYLWPTDAPTPYLTADLSICQAGYHAVRVEDRAAWSKDAATALALIYYVDEPPVVAPHDRKVYGRCCITSAIIDTTSAETADRLAASVDALIDATPQPTTAEIDAADDAAQAADDAALTAAQTAQRAAYKYRDTQASADALRHGLALAGDAINAATHDAAATLINDALKVAYLCHNDARAARAATAEAASAASCLSAIIWGIPRLPDRLRALSADRPTRHLETIETETVRLAIDVVRWRTGDDRLNLDIITAITAETLARLWLPVLLPDQPAEWYAAAAAANAAYATAS